MSSSIINVFKQSADELIIKMVRMGFELAREYPDMSFDDILEQTEKKIVLPDKIGGGEKKKKIETSKSSATSSKASNSASANKSTSSKTCAEVIEVQQYIDEYEQYADGKCWHISPANKTRTCNKDADETYKLFCKSHAKVKPDGFMNKCKKIIEFVEENPMTEKKQPKLKDVFASSSDSNTEEVKDKKETKLNEKKEDKKEEKKKPTIPTTKNPIPIPSAHKRSSKIIKGPAFTPSQLFKGFYLDSENGFLAVKEKDEFIIVGALNDDNECKPLDEEQEEKVNEYKLKINYTKGPKQEDDEENDDEREYEDDEDYY